MHLLYFVSFFTFIDLDNIYSQTSVPHDFWCKAKSHVILSFLLYGG